MIRLFSETFLLVRALCTAWRNRICYETSRLTEDQSTPAQWSGCRTEDVDFVAFPRQPLVVAGTVPFTRNEPGGKVSSMDLFKGIYAATDRGMLSPW